VLDPAALRARLADVRDRIARAAGRAGRDPSSVRLVAISKTFTADHIRAAADCGQVDFGENKVQEALPKMERTGDLPLRWHLVGHLQSNKARKAASVFDVVHSVDSAALAARLDEAAGASTRRLDWLIQVDLAGEATKHGASAADVVTLCEHAANLANARLAGLMILPPAVDNPVQARPYFRALRELRDEHDFEVAVEEGATMVRVGTAIFGSRNHV
jgi:pyridoxal phosphate enzyme (YggS family)